VSHTVPALETQAQAQIDQAANVVPFNSPGDTASVPAPASDDCLLKFTAALVEDARGCPKILQNLQKQITAHLQKANKYSEKADQHRTSAAQLFAQAKELCDDGGFAAFHKKFFPDLGRSRVYEILAIRTGKKSIAEVRSSTRERVARHRATKAATSVTVTDGLVDGGAKEDSDTAPVPPVDSPADIGAGDEEDEGADDGRGATDSASGGERSRPRTRKSRFDAEHYAFLLGVHIENLATLPEEYPERFGSVLDYLLNDSDFIEDLAALARQPKVAAILATVVAKLDEVSGVSPAPVTAPDHLDADLDIRTFAGGALLRGRHDTRSRSSAKR
jgi:hypothetical protein